MDFNEFINKISCIQYKDYIYPINPEEKKLILSDFKRFEDIGKNKSDPALYYLSAFIYAGYDALSVYESMGVCDEIALSTLSDISVWARWYERHTGRIGLDRIRWLRKHISASIFRLGELQFEKAEFPLFSSYPDFSLPCLSVHVPEGADLSEAEDSFHRALSFFGLGHAVFLMHSWLLSPEISSMLPPHSRIRQFASLFTLSGTENDRQAEERIFSYLSSDPSSYPVTSSLSAAAKAFLSDGGMIYSGIGYLLR